MLVFKCDCCSSFGTLNPETKSVLDKDGKEVFEKYKTMNFSTGKMIISNQPKVEDLSLRVVVVQLTVGTQSVARHVCSKCLADEKMVLINSLWKEMENWEPK